MQSARDYVVDDSTKRLLELTSTKERNEDAVDEIINLVNEKAPKVFEGLANCNKVAIAKSLYLKCYEFDEVVFRQGDLPDAYYTVIRGAVSLYAHSSKSEDCANSNERSKRFGKFLVQLPPGASFGELSFNDNCEHSRRNAGVVSDGSHGQTRVVVQTGIVNAEGTHGEIEASNVSVLMLVPEKTYMEELFARHTAKHETKQKIQFLKASLLFKEWPMDELVKLAYAMRKKMYNKGSVILSQGDRVDSVAIVKKGIVKIVHKMTKQRKSKMLPLEGRKNSLVPNQITSESVDIAVDIAETGPHDLIGIVEAMTNSKKMRNEALAQNQVEIFFIQNNMFTSFLKQERETSTHLEKLVEKRIKWEELRRDYASRFTFTMPMSLPKKAAKMSHYLLSRDSILSDKELSLRSRKRKDLFRLIREARSMLSKLDKTKSNGIASLPIHDIELKCQEAISLADELGDKQRKAQIEEIMIQLKQV